MTRHKTLAIVSGLAIAAAHPEPSIWPLGWVGLAPLLYAIRGKTPRRAFFLGWLAGMALYLPLLYWIAPTISNFTKITGWQAAGILVLLCIVLAFAIGAFAALVEWLAQAGISRVIAAPIVWVCVEWLRSYYPAPCPWALLGYSQYEVRTVIQIADLGAVYLVSAVLVFVNAAIAEIARAGWRGRTALVTAVVGVPVLVVGYGVVRLAVIDSYAGGTTINVGVAQANVPQDQKWDREYQDSTMAAYIRLSREAAAAGAELVVWPEASVPFFVPQNPRSVELERVAQETGAELFVGTPGYERTESGGRHYNRAWQIHPDRGLSAHYDKIQLVPFGEYVPFGFLLSWVDRAVEVVGDFGRGQDYTVFDGPSVPDGSRAQYSGLICYEGIFPSLARRFVAGGAGLLLNVSNDAWYGDTSAPYQHLAMASVRAVENRVPVVRATNTGVSAVIDRAGRIRAETALFEEAWFTEPVDVGYAGSIYTEYGDWFVYLCAFALLMLIGVRLRNGSFLTA